MTDDRLKEQFLDIFEKHIGIIIKIARVYTKVAQDREDLMNDIALELWKSFKNFNGDAKISTWMYRVALNTSMNFKRKRKHESLFFSLNNYPREEYSTWLIEPDPSPESDLLYRCIDELNEINKAIIMIYLDGKSHGEIANITGISKTNVGTRIGRIKEQLRNLVITQN